MLSRHRLGCIDANAGNFDRAIKHWLIAASFGNIRALNDIRFLYIDGIASKDQYAQALREDQLYLDEVRSGQRDKTAVDSTRYKYLIDDPR